MFKRQTTGSVVCSSCGSLVGVRDEKCYNCGRRNPGLWGFAPLLRSLGNDLGFVQLVIWGCSAMYVISLLLSRSAMSMGGGLFGFLAPDLVVLYLLGASGGRPGVRVRMVVDGVQRKLAARQPSSHHLQHDVGARSRPGRREHVRGGAHGHHLHGCRRIGLSPELVCLRLSAASAVLERRGRHRRSLGIGVRLSRGAGVLRAADRKLADALRSDPLCAHSRFLRIRHARRGQLRACGGVFRRLPRGARARSAQARADRSHRDRAHLHRRGVARHRGVGRHGAADASLPQ